MAFEQNDGDAVHELADGGGGDGPQTHEVMVGSQSEGWTFDTSEMFRRVSAPMPPGHIDT